MPLRCFHSNNQPQRRTPFWIKQEESLGFLSCLVLFEDILALMVARMQKQDIKNICEECPFYFISFRNKGNILLL